MSLWDEPGALAVARVERVELPGGAFVLRSPEPLGTPVRAVGDWLERWARDTPDAPFLAERDPTATDGWRRLAYGQTRKQVGRLAQGLLDRRLAEGAPVVVLSDNAIDHALLTLAAMYVGRPVCAVTPAYSRMTNDHAKLARIVERLRPALVYASGAQAYAPALAAIAAAGFRGPVFCSTGADALPGAEPLAALAERAETAAVRAAFDAVTQGTHAKYLLTSGSTGLPKVVVNTHGMLAANQQQIAQCWPFLRREAPRLLDWLPWSHTFGANHNFHLALSAGGSLAIDDGRPAPGLIERTVRNLRDVKPNLYFNVPRGFDVLLPFLESDRELAREVFGAMRLLFYAGAALPQATWERLEAVARDCGAEPPWFTSAWGATETSPLVTSVHWRIGRAGCIGLPAPGTEVKFVPNGGKLEMRVKGPQVFAGYRDAPELTAAAFDDDGYYRIGDAGRLVDPARPEAGIAFDGRVAEDFKLTSGTWVSVGTLRLALVSALSPLAQDAVITGHDRDEVGALLFVSPQGRALAPAALCDAVAAKLAALNRAAGGASSQTVARVLLLDEPPNLDAGEITDKGYVNQRAVLERRAAAVDRLHAGGDDVIRS
jgi:feruloyl-CoA synthase